MEKGLIILAAGFAAGYLLKGNYKIEMVLAVLTVCTLCNTVFFQA
jgi:hypothetical protein